MVTLVQKDDFVEKYPIFPLRDWFALAEAEYGLFFALPAECGGRLGHTSLAFLRRLSVAHGEGDLSAIAAKVSEVTIKQGPHMIEGAALLPERSGEDGNHGDDAPMVELEDQLAHGLGHLRDETDAPAEEVL